jgi:hypothetical protein
MKMREEHHIEIGKENVKKIKMFVFDRLDTLIGRDPLYIIGWVDLPRKKSYYKI